MIVTTKCQVTIPIKVRKRLGLFPGTEVDFVIEGDEVWLVKTKSVNESLSRGEDSVACLTGKGNLKMTTEEIMQLTRDWDEDDSS